MDQQQRDDFLKGVSEFAKKLDFSSNHRGEAEEAMQRSLHPLEIKRSVNPGTELVKAFNVLDKGSVKRGKGAIVCMRPELSAVNAENYIVPVWMI